MYLTLLVLCVPAIAGFSVADRGNHTETVDLDFDPAVVSYDSLVSKFWQFHDSTLELTTQYMSAIFYHSDEQKEISERSKARQQESYDIPIVTKILPAITYYEAEGYHQKNMLQREWRLFRSLHLSGPELIRSHMAAKLNGYVAGYGSWAQFQEDSRDWALAPEQIKVVRRAQGYGNER